jgi:hypothetical protein
METVRCAYCYADVEETDVPHVTNDAEWEALAEQHAEGCEWIETRAHRAQEEVE